MGEGAVSDACSIVCSDLACSRYLEGLADLEGVAELAPLRLREAPQGQLVVEHGRRLGEGQRLVDHAQHEGVVQDEVRGVPPAEADVGDGCVPLQPQAVQPVLEQRPAPRRVLLLQQGELKDLQHTRR